jgi:circadian clock protein KaiC
MDFIQTGVPGLDELFCGGLVPGRMYLVRGEPGTGKTIMGMHFLREGLDENEDVLFVHGEESREDIVRNAAELDIDLEGADFLDLGPESDFFTGDRSYDLVDPQDVQDAQFIDDIRDAIERIDPTRVCIDPVTQLRYVESSRYQFRKRLISLMRVLKDRDTTILATRTAHSRDSHDDELASLSDGIVELERNEETRRIRVPKHRGVGQKDGSHGLSIRENGIEVYASLVPQHHDSEFELDLVPSGVEELDTMLGGGLEAGTATFISGPTGVGKSTIGTYFLAEMARRGERPIAYLFEESLETFTYRSETFGIPISDSRASNDLFIEQVEPLTLSPEEFAHKVKRQVERHGTNFVMIDGTNGYKMSIQGPDRRLNAKLHAVVRYLTNIGVTVLLLDETRQMTGMPTPTSTDVSYVADNILFLSYLESNGSLHRVVGVLKKRIGEFEHTLREFQITGRGLEIGDPLTGVRGILRGSPEWLDAEQFTDAKGE